MTKDPWTMASHDTPTAPKSSAPTKAPLRTPMNTRSGDDAARDKVTQDGEIRENSEKTNDNRPQAAPATSLTTVNRRGSLALRDPLQAYINEARRYALLSREEEHDLAVRYLEEGDLDAARLLVTSNLRLVVKIAHEYRKAYRNLLDLVQEGNIGLMHAVKKFDPYRGVKLSSYAAWWIRAYILKFILNNWRMVRIGTTQNQRKLFFNLRKEMDRLQQMGVDNPGPKLLAERLDVPEHEVRSMQERLAGSDVSLDAPLHTDDGTSASRLDFIAAANMGPDAQVEEDQFSEIVRRKVREFGRSLTGRDKEIFGLRTVADEPLTLQEIGNRYGITRERARQIERRMMDHLRDYLRRELGDSVDVALGTSRA
ncbi:MAG: RNA polymerase factor sigma-32 [Deltaproteobacteria bacterium]|nr:RNA polymerase factor sigma-32 [Deltaproteobacteria bacterium]